MSRPRHKLGNRRCVQVGTNYSIAITKSIHSSELDHSNNSNSKSKWPHQTASTILITCTTTRRIPIPPHKRSGRSHNCTSKCLISRRQGAEPFSQTWMSLLFSKNPSSESLAPSTQPKTSQESESLMPIFNLHAVFTFLHPISYRSIFDFESTVFL